MDIKSNDQAPDGFDWKNGCWINEKEQKPDAEIIISGDWAPIRAFDEIIENSPESIYGNVLPVLRSSDLRITNLECTLFGDTPVWKSGAVFKGRPEHIKGLTSVPFEIVTLANNHVFDYGIDSFKKTLELLNKNSMKFLGAGMSAEEACSPLIIDLKGIKIGIINFSEGEDLTSATDGPGVFGWDMEKVVRLTGELRSKVGIVIVICHCGVEYIAFPPPYITEAFRRIADAGADLIIGHHPHVPQGIQIYNGVPVCYSLGNFVFYQETELQHRKTGYLVKAGISKDGVSGISVIPYEIGARNLSLIEGEKRKVFLDDLKMISAPLSDETSIRDAWNGFLRYYGVNGFKKEIDTLMNKISEEPKKGAAMFRNRIATMQHNQHWIDAMTRIIEGKIDESPDWAYELTTKWLTEKR
jgi:hypothetical protein